MATDVKKKTVTGESTKGFTEATEDAATRIGEDAGLWKPTDWEVEVEHHSPSHIKTFRVTLSKH